jgi:serine/threonine protein kinase
VEEIVKKMQTKLEQNIVPLSMGYALPGGEESAGEGVKTAYPEAQGLLNALNYVAKKGLVGGDLHDENVMIRPRTDELVIADLGNFKLVAEQQSLQEAMPEEREHIEAALKLAPEQLAFNDLFDGKKRLVYDLPAVDKETEAGQFISLWPEMGYKVDWNKGMVSGERSYGSPDATEELLVDLGLQAPDIPGAKARRQTRTVKMKI